MKIKVYTQAKIRQKFILDGEDEFKKRIKAFSDFELIELPGEKFSKLPIEKQKEKEEELLIDAIDKRDYLVILDENGKSFKSEDFAKWLANNQSSGVSSIAFAIGGPNGWNENIKKSAKLILSLSEFTFPYQLTRLILTEQLYRVFTIINNQPYHKA